jgi:hypothetical protein
MSDEFENRQRERLRAHGFDVRQRDDGSFDILLGGFPALTGLTREQVAIWDSTGAKDRQNLQQRTPRS